MFPKYFLISFGDYFRCGIIYDLVLLMDHRRKGERANLITTSLYQIFSCCNGHQSVGVQVAVSTETEHKPIYSFLSSLTDTGELSFPTQLKYSLIFVFTYQKKEVQAISKFGQGAAMI